MSRWKAAAIHLSISLLLAADIACLLYFVWFPEPWSAAAGANTLILLLMGVDVCIGPLLTLLVVNPRKARRLLRLDLAVICLLQAIAFGYGLHVVIEARPVFIVAEVDRLVMVSAEQLSDEDLAQGTRPEYRRRSYSGPLLVGAQPPTGKEADAFGFQVLSTGKDIDRMPKYYLPYDQAIGSVMQLAKPLSTLKHATAPQRAELARLQAQNPSQQLVALPLARGDHGYTVVMSVQTKRPVAVIAIDPWD